MPLYLDEYTTYEQNKWDAEPPWTRPITRQEQYYLWLIYPYISLYPQYQHYRLLNVARKETHE